jgi:hypothetical protein
MLMLGDKHCRKAGRYLKNRAEGLALHADELSRVLGTVSSVFGQRSVELSCLILRLWRGMSSKSQTGTSAGYDAPITGNAPAGGGSTTSNRSRRSARCS